LLSDDLHQHTLAASSVKLAVADLFLRAEIQRAVGARDDDLSPHDLSLPVCIGVVLAGAIVAIAVGGLAGANLQPFPLTNR